MKKLLMLMGAAILVFAASCERTDPTPVTYTISVQLAAEGANLAVAGINVILSDASGSVSYEVKTDENGTVSFEVPAGNYTASATYKTAEDGMRIAYNGSNSSIIVAEGSTAFKIDLNKAVSQQIIIKEVYNGGCPKNDASGNFFDDMYIILYNNSDLEADATDIVFSICLPYNGNGSNKFLVDDKLLYEEAGWLPAASAIWWFNNSVTIPAYSQIVIAVFGAIDHTQTVTASVDLSNPDYYWMSNTDIITVFKNAKYTVAESIPATHYMSGYPTSAGNAWVLSNASPALYIGKMDKAAAEALAKDADNYDRTLLTSAKFPQANVVDAVEIWSQANVSKGIYRFPATINTGYIALTNGLGHTIYRNVDKEATEALEENAGKLVYGYAGGTLDADTNAGSTDPSGIDAEASIAAGAHIIYSDTNDSSKDFHERAVASIKK